MSEDAIIGAAMRIALICVMFGMGLMLTWLDFRRVVLMPRVVFLGVMAQMLMLPLIALGAVYAFSLPTSIAIGIFLVAICPGGPVSNFFSHVSGGDPALALTLTMTTTLLSLVSLPAYFEWTSLGSYAQSGVSPTMYIFKSLSIGVVAPTVLGMFVRVKWPTVAARLTQSIEKIGLALILVVLSLILYKNRVFYSDITSELLLSVVFVNIGSMVCGFVLASIFRLNLSTRITYAYEVGLHNIPLATVLSFGLFYSDTRRLTVIFAVVGLYAVISILSALGSIFFFRQLFSFLEKDQGIPNKSQLEEI